MPVCDAAGCSGQLAGVGCADDGNGCTADVCDGAGTCTHPLKPAGTTCRAAAGACDVAEVCDGATLGCPADVILPAGTPCRAAADPCDVPEACTGTNTECPADAHLPGCTTTSTTLPCAQPQCILAAVLETGACADESIPPAIRRKLDRAVALLGRASASPAPRAKRLLHRAARVLAQAGHDAMIASRRRHPKLSRVCAAALRTLRSRLASQVPPR